MGRLDVTTQELFRRLGATSQARSTKADLLFRRLRLETSDQIMDALARAPKMLDGGALEDDTAPSKPNKARLSRKR